jgi:hypothetical protein
VSYRVYATSHYGPTPKRIALFTRKTLAEAVTRIAFYERMRYSQFCIMGSNGARYNRDGTRDN